MTRSVSIVAAVLLTVGCGVPPPLVSEAPIPAMQGVGGGGLYLLGTINGGDSFPLLIDTGAALTAHHAPEHPRVVVETLRVLDANGVPRVEFPPAQVLETPLGPVGIGGQDLAVGGVLGGDLLQSFRVKLRYGGAPTITLLPGEIGCSCALAGACQAVLPFTLAGGGTFAPDESGNIFNYKGTRVTIDVCLQPVVDPLSRGTCCEDNQSQLPLGYTRDGTPGVDARLLVATGFPGVLLGASAYDRLHERLCGRLAATPWETEICRRGPSQTLLAGATVEIRFLNPAATIQRAALVNLGDPSALFGAPGQQRSQALAALAIVGRERLLSPCVELARSRRLRAHPPQVTDCSGAPRPAPDSLNCLQDLSSTGTELCDNPDRCNDRDQPAAAYIELDDPLPVYVVADTAAVLQEVNFDIRSTLSVVEGVVGSELLSRLEAEIDYPNRRIIAHCGAVVGCTAYPRYACAVAASDCAERVQDPFDLCNPPSSIVPGGPICRPSPVEQRRQADAGVVDASVHCDGGAPD